ncbi:MAG: DNA repair protein RadA [Proteobacteria bacterium]|nr:DNA repair protein RadA [Pseudomonadota bacterium]MBK9252954.1 DNA repair protein RadA [Pseudomonadota bacterium]
MARAQTVHVCDACHGESPKWQGQCPHCGAWNTLTAQIAPAAGRASATRRASLTPTGGASGLAEAMRATPEGSTRTGVGMGELDRVLGGGLVPGSVTLIGGEPGIGKSTLLLQVAQGIAGSPAVLYATGEESVDQVAMRARRLEGAFGHVQVVAQTDLDTILELTARIKPALLIVDSIQTMALASVPSAAGAVTQLRECTAALVRQAKSSATAVVIVGHVTKDGAIAGPRMLEHLVDTVLYFERDAGSRFRRVRAAKNRFGAAHELGFFLMQDNGLREVKNPAAIFLSRAPQPVIGSLVMVTRDGTRPLLVEVQGLVDASRLGAPRRVAQGIDAGRLAMVLAVLNRHGGIGLQEHDVFANVVGGLDIDEPAWDLPVALALASSLREFALPPDLVVFGELGLTGEVRPVTFGEERIREAAKLGYRRALVPEANVPRQAVEGIEVRGVARIEDAIRKVLG